MPIYKKKSGKKPRKPYLMILALALLIISPALAQQAPAPTNTSSNPKVGDVIFSAGYQYSALKSDVANKNSGLAFGLEYYTAADVSLKGDYSKVKLTQETSYEASLAKHIGVIYFEGGVAGFGNGDRNSIAWGPKAGLGFEVWASEHLGFGAVADYVYLQNTKIADDLIVARGSVKLRF